MICTVHTREAVCQGLCDLYSTYLEGCLPGYEQYILGRLSGRVCVICTVHTGEAVCQGLRDLQVRVVSQVQLLQTRQVVQGAVRNGLQLGVDEVQDLHVAQVPEQVRVDGLQRVVPEVQVHQVRVALEQLSRQVFDTVVAQLKEFEIWKRQ